MEGIIKKNQYKIITILITILFFLLFKDFPYVGIFLNYQVLLIFLALLIAILFRLKAETMIKISLVLYLITMTTAVLGIGVVDTLGTAAFGVFLFGWFESIVSLLLERRKQK